MTSPTPTHRSHSLQQYEARLAANQRTDWSGYFWMQAVMNDADAFLTIGEISEQVEARRAALARAAA